MSVTVDWIVGANTYALSGREPYAFISLTGMGNPPVRRIKERGPQQHGATDVGFLLDERMLSLALLITGSTLELVDSYRDDLADMLKPSNSAGKLRVTRDDGTVRQIDCHVATAVDFPNTLQERIGASQLVVVQFEAADPIWYDPALNNVIFDISDNTSGIEIPVAVPVLYANTTVLDAVESITYAGKWETFPIIYVTGPANDLVITNEATGKVLDFTGTNIAALDAYTIDLRYGYKTVTDAAGARQNAALTDASNLVDWSLAPSPDAPGGINDIRVEIASGLTAATLIRVEYYNRYPSA